jgi:FMN phosphatase YigB (HAD superfamily)
MLGDIDSQHELELERLEASNTDQDLKHDIRRKLVARHRERREPYVELLTVLRQQQHRLALAA